MPYLNVQFTDDEKDLLNRMSSELGVTPEKFVHDAVFPKPPEDGRIVPPGGYPEKEEKIYVD